MSDTQKAGSPSEKLILVVDDDENVRSLTEMVSKMDGFQVITACDGKDAAVKLKSQIPDLIISDLMMPRQGGFEFIRSLQEAGKASIPVFVITGSKLDDSTFQMIRQENNVVAVFHKPIQVNGFMAAVHKFLNTIPPGSKP